MVVAQVYARSRVKPLDAPAEPPAYPQHAGAAHGDSDILRGVKYADHPDCQRAVMTGQAHFRTCAGANRLRIRNRIRIHRSGIVKGVGLG